MFYYFYILIKNTFILTDEIPFLPNYNHCVSLHQDFDTNNKKVWCAQDLIGPHFYGEVTGFTIEIRST